MGRCYRVVLAGALCWLVLMGAGCRKAVKSRVSIIQFAEQELITLPEGDVMTFQEGLRQGVKMKSGYKKPKDGWQANMHGPRCMWEFSEDGEVTGHSEMIDLNWAIEGPWHLWPRDEKAENYVLVVGYKMEGLSDSSHVGVHLFSDKGIHIGGVYFGVGEKEDALAAKYEANDRYNAKVLELDTKSPVLGTRRHRLYLGHIGDRLALLRAEVLEKRIPGGKLPTKQISNDYSSETVVRGPLPPERSPGDWAAALDSENPFEVLEALTWIGGTHGSAKSADTRASARSQGAATLNKLAGSSDPWLSEGAQLALGAR